MTVDTLAPLNVRSLNAHDRCDRCGAQAYMAVDIVPAAIDGVERLLGVELLFCAHHGRVHAEALLAQGAVFTADETAKLNEGNRLQGVSH